MVKPSTLALFRLMMSSYLVGACRRVLCKRVLLQSLGPTHLHLLSSARTFFSGPFQGRLRPPFSLPASGPTAVQPVRARRDVPPTASRAPQFQTLRGRSASPAA